MLTWQLRSRSCLELKLAELGQAQRQVALEEQLARCRRVVEERRR